MRRMISFIILAMMIVGMAATIAVPITAWHERAQTAEAQSGDEDNRYHTGSFPRAMAFDGELVWVANWGDNSITRLSVADGTVIDTLTERIGEGPVAMAWVGRRMWVAIHGANDVRTFLSDGSYDQVFGLTHGINVPVALLYESANDSMWIVNQGVGEVPGSVVQIEIQTGLFNRYPVGRFPTAITYDGKRIWVANGLDNSLSVLDAETGEAVATIAVNAFPISLAFDGIHVWVSHYDGSIKAIRSSDLRESEEILLDALPGDPPRPVQLLYAFEHIWVTNVHSDNDTSNIVVLKALDGSLVTTRPVDTAPISFPGTLTYTDTHVWVVDWLSQRVVTIEPSDIWRPDPANAPEVIESTPGIWLPTPEPTSTPQPTATPIPCNPDIEARLVVGGRGRVNDHLRGAPLNLRSAPGTANTQVVAQYTAGAEFEVIGGPECVEIEPSVGEVSWFQVRMEDGSEGWFIEYFQDGYTVDPLPAEDE
ncbi:MAG: SH3 domain-containing protein [Chloroflexi bacterium]|nr:SH3 domain-containing protein [Chloroflexota bacterium]